MNIIKAVDVSSHQRPNLRALRQWIAEGCQLLIVKSYQRAESGLAQTTRDHVANAQAAGVWTLPYVWLYRSVDPRESIRTSLDLFRSTGEKPGAIFLDCETYENPGGSIDPGPDVGQILAASTQARDMGVEPVLYTGVWWLDSHLEGDTARLDGMPAWIANYALRPTLDVPAPNWVKVLGHQYTSTPVDWSIFDLDALKRLIEPDAPPADPCAELRDGIRAAIADVDALRERLAALVS